MQIKAVIFDLNDVFVSGSASDNEEMIEIAKKLREKGIKVFILSNIFGPGGKELFPGIIDKAYYLNETGFIKPDPRAWQFVLDENSLKAEECLYFDNMQFNVTGAQSLGIESYLFKGIKPLKETLKSHNLL